MKIAIAQLNYHIGNFEQNTSKIIDTINNAKKENIDLVVFSELAVCGYPPRDFLEFSDFIYQCENAVQKIAAICNGIAAIVGSPSINNTGKGKPLFNSAFLLADGKIKSVHHKGLLPNYDVFDEYRYFEPAKDFFVAEYKGLKIALTICEDIWDEELSDNQNPKLETQNPKPEISNRKLYTYWPMEALATQNPDIMINIAASPFHYYHSEERKKIIRANCRKYKLPVIYVNHVGAQTELIFDGGSIIAGANENLIYECDYFKEQFLVIDTSELETPAVKNASDNSFINIKEIVPPQLQKFNPEKTFDALVLGIKDYFFKQNFSKAILGLSGGIDSAIVLCIAIKALGKENVMSVLMPSRYSSENSVNDALELLKNTKSPHENIPIEKIHTATELTLQGNFANTASGLAEENIQARIRAVLLMALSNKFGYILLNTSNKSETAVGYGTLYGDMCGGISPLGDVYKTQAYALAEYINRGEKIIPKAIIEKAPSAELKPSQKDSDSLPEYDILDPVLYKYIEENLSPDEIIKQGYSAPLVQRVLKLVNTNEYKRYQTPPILRVSPKAFGMGRRMPIVGKYLS